MQDVILILDLDEALSGLIARTLRNQQIYCEPVPFTVTREQVEHRTVKGLIIAARNNQTIDLDGFDLSLLEIGVPVLALGGMAAALCAYYGGEVRPGERENESITLGMSEHPLFEGMSRGERVLHHLNSLILPQPLACMATATERCIGFSREAGKLYAIQYPVERNDPDAVQLLHNFAFSVCDFNPYWNEEYITRRAVEEIRSAAGDGRVLCAVSGGVDSAVCAKLAHMAVDSRLMCVFVDTGLFRKDEPQAVIDGFQDTLGITVAYVDAKQAFMKALQGVRSTAEKEQIASEQLKRVIEQQLEYDPNLRAIVLGTNYNDTLYGSYASGNINETGDTELTVVEPVRALFKEEIRRLAGALAMPGSIAERQPFPSSGLALRILGEVTSARLEVLRTADAFFSEEIHANGQEKRLWQYYASMSENPDERHGYAIILRACQPCGGDACASRLPYDLLERTAQRILADLPEVRRVVYDLTPSQHYALLE